MSIYIYTLSIDRQTDRQTILVQNLSDMISGHQGKKLKCYKCVNILGKSIKSISLKKNQELLTSFQ